MPSLRPLAGLCISGSLRRAFTVATGYGIYIFLGWLYVFLPFGQGYHGMTGAVVVGYKRLVRITLPR